MTVGDKPIRDLPIVKNARTQAMAQRRNLLNIERELLADAANIQRHAASIRKAIDEIEKEHSFESTGPVEGITVGEASCRIIGLESDKSQVVAIDKQMERRMLESTQDENCT